MPVDTCVKCGRFGPGNYWEYEYGRRRRGVRLATLEPDSRPLGAQRDFVCRHCDLSLFWLGLREFVGRHPFEAVATVAIAAMLLAGYSITLTFTGWIALAMVLSGVALTWFQWHRRRRNWMAKLTFAVRKSELAASHGLKPTEIELYPHRDPQERPSGSRPAA